MPDVNMPKLSDTMEEGTIVEWKKKTGDEVKAGDVLAEVESDKATFDLEAESGGGLSILVEQGVAGKIGAPIARIRGGHRAPGRHPSPGRKRSQKAKPPPSRRSLRRRHRSLKRRSLPRHQQLHPPSR